MKIIDNKTQRELEIKRNEAARREKEEAEAKAKKERIIPTIKIILDWRLAAEYEKYIRSKEIIVWPHDGNGPKKNYFKYAIENRANLKEIVIEGYDYPRETLFNSLEIESDTATIEALKAEAIKLNLGYDEYVRGIFYTTAYVVNQEKAKKEAEHDAYVKEHTPFRVGEGFISQELKRCLEKKFGNPVTNTMFGVSESIYTELLIKLANEYFGIDPDKE